MHCESVRYMYAHIHLPNKRDVVVVIAVMFTHIHVGNMLIHTSVLSLSPSFSLPLFSFSLSSLFQDFAILDTNFNSTFSCPMDLASQSVISGSIRALCRICLNISNPDNGLVLKGNYECLPRAIVNDLSCFLSVFREIKECRPLLESLQSPPKGVTVKANHGMYNRGDGTKSLQYLAMAFRSVSVCVYRVFCLS